MGWSIGYDEERKRDIGYGVPARCDHPGCSEGIDRGLSYICGGDIGGGEHGCGLFFCGNHRIHRNAGRGLCARCAEGKPPFDPAPDHPDWMRWKLTDESWAPWRAENPDEVAFMEKALAALR